mmetsp:Transcript_14958/g.29895  ORF Transcript_14958/g.29895 Transcript_14958/m.29895 type:complete len:187 (-) Transcript_14958:102-662(-)
MLKSHRLFQGLNRRLLTHASCSMARGLSTISTAKARALLGLTECSEPTLKELRIAYFQAAKRSHPDSSSSSSLDAGQEFRRITNAYELLLGSGDLENSFQEQATHLISEREEENYRKACLAVLGIPAEIVEESKQNPMFREWLAGNTDGAIWWRMFFSNNGGLAQKLRPPTQLLTGKIERRRRSRT